MAKLVDALALGASAARHEGSSPFPGTNVKKQSRMTLLFYICAREVRHLRVVRKDLNRGRESFSSEASALVTENEVVPAE